MMFKQPQHIAKVMLMACMFLPFASLHHALAQTTVPAPVSLAHLYWHFLTYQKHLDTTAAAQVSQGKDGSQFRNALQTELGFSDAEFAPIRTSSSRLAATVTDLDRQAVAIKSGEPSTSSSTQLKSLSVQREAAISAEIAYLKRSLPPKRISAFESFLVQFFAPNKSLAAASSVEQTPAVQ